ncbi:MAG TPA: hypothetical protein VFJ72_11815 [Rubrobacteraceae bacterium]|nr:hypothetical protein [Rubrobacteraceae bacterium]
MTTSGIEESAARLLEAFYDLSRGRLKEPVRLRKSDSPRAEGAAQRAGMDPTSTEPDVAVRYLLNQGYVEATGTNAAYAITVPGMDLVRQRRGLEDPPSERKKMSDKRQRQLVTALAIIIAMVLTRPITRFIDEEIPERRGIKDDLLEAALQGLVRAAAIFAASAIVRKLASR